MDGAAVVQASWDSVDVERVRTCCDPAASADLAAVLITVRGRAALLACVLSSTVADVLLPF